jgi:hypothetical protein
MLNGLEFRRQVAARKYHLVNPLDGKRNFFKCVRCNRDLPENCFFPVARASRLENKGSSTRARLNITLVLNGVCLTCRKQQKGKWASDPLYSPGLDRYFALKRQSLSSQASKRGLFLGVDKDDLLGLYIKQEGYCALTGIAMNWKAKGTRGRDQSAASSPSVDRIDSGKDYTLDNVQIVLQAVNRMKGTLPQEAFLELCRAAATHHMLAL